MARCDLEEGRGHGEGCESGGSRRRGHDHLVGGCLSITNSRRKIGESLTDKGNKATNQSCLRELGKMTCGREEKLQMKGVWQIADL